LTAGCSHRPPCPGCPRFGAGSPAEESLAGLRALAREAKLEWPSIVGGPPLASRHRARLAVRGRAQSPKIGLFAEGSHRIVDIPRCPIHHPGINDTVAEIKAAIRETNTQPYIEKGHRGLLRYLQLVVERASGQVQVVLVANSLSASLIEPLAAAVEARLGDRLQGLFWNGQTGQTNRILGPHFSNLAGASHVVEGIDGTTVFFPPGAFGQSNLTVFERLAARARQLVPERSSVAELYAGVGAIGLGLLEKVTRIHFNERSEDAIAGLEAGLVVQPAAEKGRAHLFPGAAEERLEALDGCNVAIVDPPRRGLATPVVERLCARPVERLIYVSCGPEALVSEALQLKNKGGYQLAGLEVFDLFPFTDHVEALAWFDR
jgi:23S rRNA (uracil1939-C5)-methyltransferase